MKTKQKKIANQKNMKKLHFLFHVVVARTLLDPTCPIPLISLSLHATNAILISSIRRPGLYQLITYPTLCIVHEQQQNEIEIKSNRIRIDKRVKWAGHTLTASAVVK